MRFDSSTLLTTGTIKWSAWFRPIAEYDLVSGRSMGAVSLPESYLPRMSTSGYVRLITQRVEFKILESDCSVVNTQVATLMTA